MNLSSKIFFVITIFATIIVALVFFAILPLMANIQQSSSEIVQKKSEIDNYNDRVSRARLYALFLKDEEANLAKTKSIFVDGKMPLNLINSIEDAAKNTDIGIEFLPVIINEIDKSEWPYIGLEANISGNIPAIMRFVGKMESGSYLANIDSFVLEAISVPRSIEGGEGNMVVRKDIAGKARILLNIYAEK